MISFMQNKKKAVCRMLSNLYWCKKICYNLVFSTAIYKAVFPSMHNQYWIIIGEGVSFFSQSLILFLDIPWKYFLLICSWLLKIYVSIYFNYKIEENVLSINLLDYNLKTWQGLNFLWYPNYLFSTQSKTQYFSC